jgi:hypothetical protein
MPTSGLACLALYWKPVDDSSKNDTWADNINGRTYQLSMCNAFDTIDCAILDAQLWICSELNTKTSSQFVKYIYPKEIPIVSI